MMDNAHTRETKKSLVSALAALENSVRHVTYQLGDANLSSVLDAALHDPENLPDRELEAVATQLVDTMEALQLRLVPSVMLLADGFFGYMNSKVLAAAVEAQVPDTLQVHGPLTVSELSPFVGLQPERLAQLMDTLVNNGIFTRLEGDDGTDACKYTNNRCSALLRRDHWTQWHLWADLYPNRFYDIGRSIAQASRLGETRSAAQIEYGTNESFFKYLDGRDEAGIFHRTLGAGAVAMSRGLGSDYPWHELGDVEVVDLGGGSGDLLAAILREEQSVSGGLRGCLVDLQHVVDLVRPELDEPGGRFQDLGDRLSAEAGDFFGNIRRAPVYVMKWCLHNWMDDDAVRILRNARDKMLPSPVSRFVILESVKRPGRSGRLPRYGDLIMMMTVNGKERSLEEWSSVAERGGWRVNRIMPIRNSWVCAIELLPM